MFHDPLRADDQALGGYRLLVVQQAFVAARPICETLASQGGEIVGPVSTIAAAVALVACEPVDIAIVELPERTDARPLLALLASEAIPVVILDESLSRLPGEIALLDLVERVCAKLEPPRARATP